MTLTRTGDRMAKSLFQQVLLVSAAALLGGFVGALVLRITVGGFGPVRLPMVANGGSDLQVAVMEARVDAVIAYQEIFFDIVLWGFGTVLALGGLLVGYGWYQSRLANERELRAMERELRHEAATQAVETESTH